MGNSRIESIGKNLRNKLSKFWIKNSKKDRSSSTVDDFANFLFASILLFISSAILSVIATDELIKNIYVINLDRRPDRLQIMSGQLDTVG